MSRPRRAQTVAPNRGPSQLAGPVVLLLQLWWSSYAGYVTPRVDCVAILLISALDAGDLTQQPSAGQEAVRIRSTSVCSPCPPPDLSPQSHPRPIRIRIRRGQCPHRRVSPFYDYSSWPLCAGIVLCGLLPN